MSIRKLVLLTAMAAVGVLAVGAASASASTHLRLDPGNIPFSGSTTITNTSSTPATLTLTGVGTLTCNETKFDVDVNQHTSATSITGSLTTLTFTSCTDSIPVLAIPSCTLLPGTLPVVHITANTAVQSTTLVTDPTVRCNIAGSTTSFCYYTAASATGTGNNTASTLAFSSIGVTTVAGSGSLGAACGSTGTFAVTLNHIVQGGTNRTVTILPTA